MWPAAITSRPLMRPEVPLLWRTPTSVQIGDHVIVEHVTGEAIRWLAGLDGSRTCTDALNAHSIDATSQRALISAAFHAGALTDSRIAPDCWRWVDVADRVRIQQDWEAAACAFRPGSSAHPDAPTPESVIDERWRTRVAVAGTDRLAQAVRRIIADNGITLAESEQECDVTVLCSPGHARVVPSSSTTGPHLHVGTHGAISVVGPMVVPGVTSCLRCAHLHQRDADPSWPLLAVQLQQHAEGSRATARDNLLIHLSATYALILLRAWIDQPDATERWGNVALETDLEVGAASLAPLVVGRPTHPSCGCTWHR